MKYNIEMEPREMNCEDVNWLVLTQGLTEMVEHCVSLIEPCYSVITQFLR
jgi:hypothetical protein